jgi:hypothetical protein
LPLDFAIREPGLHRLNQVSEFSRHHTKNKHNALFIDGLVTQSAKIDWVPITLGFRLAWNVQYMFARC